MPHDASEAIDTAELVYDAEGQAALIRSAPTPMEMLSRAVASGAGIETIEKLMDLQERWERNQARKAFDEAIAQAKAELPPVVRNRTGHNDKKYADFSAIAKAVDAVLPKHGLSYRFRTTQGDGTIVVTCVLSHRAGHSEENSLSGPADKTGSKNDIQAIGSTLTYLQRYSLMQALGLAAANDDDANSFDNSTITAEQDDELKALVAHVGADIQKFLTAFQIESTSDLPAKRFEEAKKRLTNFGKRK